MRPNRARRPGAARPLGDFLQLGPRPSRVLVRAVVVREREALVLDRPVDGVAELLEPSAPLAGAFRELEAVTACDHHAVDADEVPRDVAGPSRDRADERVARDELAQQGPRRLRDDRVLRPRDDRRERPVDVEQNRSALRRVT